MRIYVVFVFPNMIGFSSNVSVHKDYVQTHSKFRRKREAQCSEKYATITSGHTACLSRSYSVKDSGISDADKQLIVDEHNRVRRAVYPTARNMRELSWDNEIANTAQHWAENCRIGHDKGYKRYAYGRFSVGQNLSWGSYKMTWLQAMALWSNEVKDFRYGSSNSLSAVGHYTQMVWAETAKIGCGYAQCGGTHYYVCNYGPAGNFDISKPYEYGTSCGDCPSTCRSKLCDCGGKVCLNGGTMDLRTCACKCYKDFKFYVQPSCGLNCTDIEDPYYCLQQFGRSSCERYSNVPQMCPDMCKWCPAAGMKHDDTISGTTNNLGSLFASLILSLFIVLSSY